MSYLLPFYSVFFLVLALTLVVLLVLSRSDETSQRKVARVRVLVDDNRKQRMPRHTMPGHDDDLNSETRYEWLLASAALVVLLLLLKAAN